MHQTVSISDLPYGGVVPQAVSISVFDVSAPGEDWEQVARLFVSCFSVAPYFENPDELATIAAWGPRMLADEGRLVVARSSGDERAAAARSIYVHWGFEAVGRVPMQGDGIALHVLASRTRDFVERL